MIHIIMADKKELYKPYISSNPKKKYMVYVKSPTGGVKLIHFGARGMEHYKDLIGHYKAFNHNDKERRKRYYARHGETDDKNTPKWWSNNMLWPKGD